MITDLKPRQKVVLNSFKVKQKYDKMVQEWQERLYTGSVSKQVLYEAVLLVNVVSLLYPNQL